MVGRALPVVGAQLALLGISAFNSAVKQSVTGFNQIGVAAQTAGKVATSSIEQVGKSINFSAGAIAASALAIEGALLGLGSTTAVFGAQFVQDMTNARYAVDETSEHTDKLGSLVIDLSRKWTIGARDLSKGVNTFVRAGGDFEDVIEGAYEQVVALTIASAGELGLENAILLVTGGMGAYNLRGKETARITNAIVTAANASAISYKDIYRAVPQVAMVHAALNYTVEDTLTTIALLGKEYVRNSDAGTALKQMITSMLAPSKQAQELMEAYGISLFGADKQALPLIDVIDQLHKAFGDINGDTEEMLLTTEKGRAFAKIFGSDAIRPAIILAKVGPKIFAEFKAQIAKTSAIDLAGKMIKPAASQVKVLKNNFEAFAVLIGKEVEPVFRGLLSTVNGFFAVISQEKIALIGKAFKSAFSGIGFDELRTEAEKLLSGPVNQIFQSWISLLESLRKVLMTQIIPSFIYLFNSISGGVNVSTIFVTILDSMSSTLQAIGKGIMVINVLLGDLISSFKQSALGAALLSIMFKGLLALPFVAFAAILLKIGILIAGFAAPIIIASTAIGALIYAFENLETIQGIIKSIIDWFNTLVSSILGFLAPIGRILSAIGKAIYDAFKGVIDFLIPVFEGLAVIIVTALAYIAAQSVRYAVITAAAWLTKAIPAMYLTAAGFVMSADIIIKSMGLVAINAVKSAYKVAVAWLRVMLPAVLTAVSGIIVAHTPLIVTLVAIGVASALLYKAWKSNFLGIADFTGKIFKWIADRINEFLNWLKTLPIIGDFVTGVETAFNGVSKFIGDTTKTASDALGGFIDDAKKGFPKITESLAGTFPSIDELNKKLAEMTKSGEEQEDIAKKLADAEAALNAELSKIGAQPGFLPKEGTEGDKLKALITQIERLLSSLPVMTRDLAEFLAQIAQDAPGRLAPMVAQLNASKDILRQIVDIKKQILAIDLQLIQSEANLVILNAQIAAIQARQRVVEASRARELLDLSMQRMNVEMQEWPLKDRISAIDREINKLSRENLLLVRERIQAEISLLPFKKQILAIEQQIQDAQRKDYNLLVARAQAELDILPAKQAIAAIERQITDLVDKRLELTQREQQLVAQRNLTLIERDINRTTKALDKAWENMDVPKILDLEKQLESLEDQKSKAEDVVDQINQQIEDTEYYNELAKIRLEREKLIYEEAIKGSEAYIFALTQQLDLQDKISEVAVLRLEREKQALEDLMLPYQRIIENINFEIEAEKTRNSLRINDLNIEKQALEDLLEPLELQIEAIDRATQVINNQIAMVNYASQIEKLHYEFLLAQEESRRADLELSRAKLDQVFTELVQKFVEAITISKVFTVEEAYEVAKRLGLWNDQISKLAEVYIAFSNISMEARAVKKAIDEIPREVVIRIKTIYETEGSAPSAKGTPRAYQYGGVVPGKIGEPRLIMAHGGERFYGMSRVTPTAVQTAQSRPLPSNITTTNSTNFNVNANYERVQSPGTIAMDLRSIAARARR